MTDELLKHLIQPGSFLACAIAFVVVLFRGAKQVVSAVSKVLTIGLENYVEKQKEIEQIKQRHTDKLIKSIGDRLDKSDGKIDKLTESTIKLEASIANNRDQSVRTMKALENFVADTKSRFETTEKRIDKADEKISKTETIVHQINKDTILIKEVAKKIKKTGE